MKLSVRTRRRAASRLRTVLLALLVAPACTTSGGTSHALRPIQSGTRVAVTIDDGVRPASNRRGTVSFADEAADGAVKGAVLGAGVGVGASLLCGSFFSVCAETLVPVTITSGALGGSAHSVVDAYGPIGDALIEISPEDAEAFAAILSTLDFDELQISIREELVRQTGHIWRVVDQDPEVRIIVALESLDLKQPGPEQLFLHVRTRFRILSPAASSRPVADLSYSYASGSKAAQEWFIDDGAALRSAIGLGIEQTVRQAMWGLRPASASR